MEAHSERPNPDFFCRLTNKIMVDPVIAPDSFVYERKAIQGHLERHGRSPISDMPMRVDDLTSHETLRLEIKLYNARREQDGLSQLPPELLMRAQEQGYKHVRTLKEAYDKHVALYVSAGVQAVPSLISFDAVKNWVGSLARWTPAGRMNPTLARMSLRGFMPHVSAEWLGAAAGCMVVAAETAWYLRQFYKGLITMPVLAERVSTTMIATCAAASLSMIGSMILPGVGTIIGGLLGSLMGSLLGKLGMNFLIDWICPGYVNEAIEAKNYQRALEAYNLTEKSSNDQVMHEYRQQVLSYHPDKSKSAQAPERLAEAMCNFEIIRGYREARNAWYPGNIADVD
eukprot:TRINITY_DN12006_c0_g1_i1.p1 TRINITY_DN12006_c0_g1~~TRINITY_DN12006_c0_g1_i1.p1  ORF type:complete len:342 (-),score=16.81 TRINITY_DN12006_c0_g1_i1:94-1119(-)